MNHKTRRIVTSMLLMAVVVGRALPLHAADISKEQVLRSIELAQKFLLNNQQEDGSWAGKESRYPTGVTSLALLALINSGMTADNEKIQRGLKYLRSIKEPDPAMTYEISLMISALAAAKDGNRDQARLVILAQRLESSQLQTGDNAGSWDYGILGNNGDRSNGQYAILGLRDAAYAGVPIEDVTWERARDHWIKSQNVDGGWGYSGVHNQASSGSMTVAGIATLVIIDSLLRDKDEVNADGTPKCCGAQPSHQEAIDSGVEWMANHFSVGHNPGNPYWHLYYLYGLERAGRLSGERFFGDHDWYREGVRYLVEQQSQREGSWYKDGNTFDNDPIVATSFALLFVSKGLAPVLINKLEYGTPDPIQGRRMASTSWNKHTRDIRNLVEHISGLPKWPKLLTFQYVHLENVKRQGGVLNLLQSPMLYISGDVRPEFTDEDAALFKEYLSQGGFVFAVRNCQGAGFDAGMHELVKKMFPGGEAQLKKLAPDHPIYRSEYLLEAESVELWGVDLGCRTAFVYSPEDISCLWDKWLPHDPANRSVQLKSMITKASRIGVNVVAYATGREPPTKPLEDPTLPPTNRNDQIERGLLQIAKLRHTGGWDAAPQALHNLLMALNQVAGMSASTTARSLPATDPNLFRYPLLYMHGQNHFNLSQKERDQLKTHLSRGGVLFADACCGAKPFDQSFRKLAKQMYPEAEFKRIPADHELFTTAAGGYDIREVRRRIPETNRKDVALNTVVNRGEPFLEGIEVEGRLVIIYSKYDISCALEKQASLECAGYVPEDALKIAVNIVLYAMLQDLN
ncbi:MAG: DUF4159 domain-containing protein [Planctomycetaceae bacterium]